MNEEKKLHDPVLLNKALELINPKKGDSYLDLTAGYGGHATAFLQITKNFHDSVLVDRDDFAIQHLQLFAEQGVAIIKNDFYHETQKLVECGKQFDIVLMDLGVSSPQLDIAERGFSFAKAGPLDMRMDTSQKLTASEVVNTYPEQALAKIFVDYGEENPRFARQIASKIIRSRPISTTAELADLIKANSRHKYSKTHPATKIFQAIRIEVNDELLELSNTLPLLPKLLKPGGRVGIISFHSLEDRLVKKFFKDQYSLGLEASLKPVTKKPTSGEIEDVYNPRARSAKLRVAVKQK